MAKKFIILGTICFVCLILGITPSSFPLANLSSNALGAALPSSTGGGFPPLPPGCSGAGTPIEDYTQPVCCVSGYIYVDGAPVADATVTLAAHGRTLTMQTQTTDATNPPYYIARLDTDPLTLEPGDRVTITASFQGQSHQVSFVARAGGQQIDVVMPKLNATWIPAPINTSEPSQLPPFTQWTAIGASYEQAGAYLLFGGWEGKGLSGVPHADTFRWQATGWVPAMSTTTPPARYGHALVRNHNGDRLLLFGGIDDGGFFLADTWLWHNNDWQKVQTDQRPAERAYTSLTYDNLRNVWVLFGGLGNQGVFSDTWEFDGQSWRERAPVTAPPPRRLASFTYEPQQQQAILFGGRTESQYYNDLWVWDGSAWRVLTPQHNAPAPRAGHGAAYDPMYHEVVIAGGAGPYGGLMDTWAWNGRQWLVRTANPSLPAVNGLIMDYDQVNQQMVAFGERTGGNPVGDGIWLHKVISATHDYDATPIATIQSTNQRDGRQGLDTFVWLGGGADGDATDQIVRYRWSQEAITVSTESTLTLPASALPLGTHEIAFAVQDDEGRWSTPVTQTLFVRTGDTAATGKPQPDWTLLLYVGADNTLAARLGDQMLTNGLLYRLRTAGAQAHVQVGVLYDGPGANDTQRYRLSNTGQWLVDGANLPEADMGQMTTLRDFVRWGHTNFQTEYVALALVGPANGVVGFGQDNHGATPGEVSFLTPIELRSALQAANASRGRKLDLIFFDGSSFGLLEDGSIVDDVTNFMIVSPATGVGIYPYDQYRRLAATAAMPRDLARAIAQQYAESASVYGLPFSISVFDLNHFQPLQSAVGQLGDSLLAYVGGDKNRQDAITALRRTLYSYDSNGKTPNPPDDGDLYVDLSELASTLAISVPDAGVPMAANLVGQQVRDFVVYQKNALDRQQTAGGSVIYQELTRLGGIALFYPPNANAPTGSANDAYVQNRLFPVTVDWGWIRFITSGPGDLPFCPPFLPDHLVIEPLAALPIQPIYLPIIIQQ